MAIHHAYKGIALFSLILACFVLAVAIWTFGSLMCRNKNNGRQETSNFHFNHSTITPNTDATASTSSWGEFNEMPKFFQGVIMSCDWIAVIGAILQLLISSVILVSSPENCRHRLKYFICGHIIIFFIITLTFLLPLTYDREKDAFHTMTSFNTEIKKQFWNIQENGENVVNFMVADLRPYYFTLMLDCVGVVVIIVVASCLLHSATVAERKAEFIYDRYL